MLQRAVPRNSTQVPAAPWTSAQLSKALQLPSVPCAPLQLSANLWGTRALWKLHQLSGARCRHSPSSASPHGTGRYKVARGSTGQRGGPRGRPGSTR
eukprot:9882388-Alexandrium_andersonii.AAC.1